MPYEIFMFFVIIFRSKNLRNLLENSGFIHKIFTEYNFYHKDIRHFFKNIKLSIQKIRDAGSPRAIFLPSLRPKNTTKNLDIPSTVEILIELFLFHASQL